MTLYAKLIHVCKYECDGGYLIRSVVLFCSTTFYNKHSFKDMKIYSKSYCLSELIEYDIGTISFELEGLRTQIKFNSILKSENEVIDVSL